MQSFASWSAEACCRPWCKISARGRKYLPKGRKLLPIFLFIFHFSFMISHFSAYIQSPFSPSWSVTLPVFHLPPLTGVGGEVCGVAEKLDLGFLWGFYPNPARDVLTGKTALSCRTLIYLFFSDASWLDLSCGRLEYTSEIPRDFSEKYLFCICKYVRWR